MALLLANEQFKSGCIQQVARTFEQNQVPFFMFYLNKNDRLQQVFLTASASPATEALVPIGGGVQDIYGNAIPNEICEDAMENFSSSVNAFMERKFEVRNGLCDFDINGSPCHRDPKANASGLRTRLQRGQKL